MVRFKIIFVLMVLSALACYADSGAPIVEFNPTKLDFTGVPVGSTSNQVPIILTNSGSAPLSISEIKIADGEFTQINNCPATLNPTGTCTISVSFVPTKAGKTTGTLTVTDNASGSPQKVPLTGDTITGMTLLVASNGQGSLTVTAGKAAVYNLTLTSIGNFSGAVKFDCIGLPDLTTCTFDPSSPSLSANGSVPVSVTMQTTGTTTSMRRLRNFETMFAIFGALCFGGVFGLRKARPRTALGICALALSSSVGMVACGGGSSSKTKVTTTPTGTYTVQVKATSGSTSQGIDLTLVVQ